MIPTAVFMTYILGIFGTAFSSIPLERMVIDDRNFMPDMPEFILKCFNWPIFYVYIGGLFAVKEYNLWNKKRNQLPPVPPKDRYLLEAEKEVDEFLGYSDVPEEVTVQSFNSIECDVDIRSAPAIPIITKSKYKLIYKNEYTNEIYSFKDKAYNSYLNKIKDDIWEKNYISKKEFGSF